MKKDSSEINKMSNALIDAVILQPQCRKQHPLLIPEATQLQSVKSSCSPHFKDVQYWLK